MARVAEAFKKLTGKVGLEVLVEAIAEELRSIAKSSVKDAAKATKARWLGIGLSDEAAFNHELAVLGPTGTRIITSFLGGLDAEKTNLFRLIITSLDRSEQRQEVLRNICDMDEDKRLAYFEQTISKQEYIEKAAQWITENALKMIKGVPGFAKWIWDTIKKCPHPDIQSIICEFESGYRKLERFYGQLDTPEGNAHAATMRAEQVQAMKQEANNLLICRFLRWIFS